MLRRCALCCGLATLSLTGAASAKDLVIDIPAHVIVEPFPLPNPPSDPDRCAAASFVEFPKIKKAKGYRIVATDVRYGQGTQERTGPPFPDDHKTWGQAHWDAPGGFHRVFYSADSVGTGCPDAILGLEGQWRLDSATVNMSRKFKKPYTRKKNPKCKFRFKNTRIKVRHSSDRAMVLIHKGGPVTFQDRWWAISRSTSTPRFFADRPITAVVPNERAVTRPEEMAERAERHQTSFDDFQSVDRSLCVRPLAAAAEPSGRLAVVRRVASD